MEHQNFVPSPGKVDRSVEDVEVEILSSKTIKQAIQHPPGEVDAVEAEVSAVPAEAGLSQFYKELALKS